MHIPFEPGGRSFEKRVAVQRRVLGEDRLGFFPRGLDVDKPRNLTKSVTVE